MLEQAAHEDRDVQMRRLQRAVGTRHATRLDRVEAEAPVLVGVHAPEPGEAGLDRQVAGILRMRVLAVRVRLPDLHHRVVHGRAIGVDDAALEREALAADAFGREVLVDEPGHPDVQVRTDGLGGRGVHGG
jgi:hypothetical protein